jgi:L-fuconate dehydratase
VCEAIRQVAKKLVGKPTEELFADMGQTWSWITAGEGACPPAIQSSVRVLTDRWNRSADAMVSHVIRRMHVFACRHDISGNRIGPEKGVIALATGSVLNAIWDMFARSRGKPLWQLGAFIGPCFGLLDGLTRSLGGSLTQSATSRRKSL